MIPTVSEGVGRGDFSRVNAQIESATGFAIIIAALFVPMFAALGEPIGRFVYGNETAGKFLSASAWLLIPLSVENITSSVMNSLDLEIRSFVNYLIGSAVSFIIMFAFYGSFRINLLGFALGVGWSTTCVLHLLSIRKKIGLRMSFAGKGGFSRKPRVLCARRAGSRARRRRLLPLEGQDEREMRCKEKVSHFRREKRIRY